MGEEKGISFASTGRPEGDGKQEGRTGREDKGGYSLVGRVSPSRQHHHRVGEDGSKARRDVGRRPNVLEQTFRNNGKTEMINTEAASPRYSRPEYENIFQTHCMCFLIYRVSLTIRPPRKLLSESVNGLYRLGEMVHCFVSFPGDEEKAQRQLHRTTDRKRGQGSRKVAGTRDLIRALAAVLGSGDCDLPASHISIPFYKSWRAEGLQRVGEGGE